MGSLFIRTAISSQRVENAGQPPWETIELDAWVSLPDLLVSSYAETARFSDYRRLGGPSVRYYHLPEYRRGLALSISASGPSRVISGLYEDREIVMANQAIDVSRLLAESVRQTSRDCLLPRKSLIHLQFEDGGFIVARFNCYESFPQHVEISASLRVPQVLFKGLDTGSALEQFAQEHLSADQPLFTLLECGSVDLRVTLVCSSTLSSRPYAKLEFRNDARLERRIVFAGLAD